MAKKTQDVRKTEAPNTNIKWLSDEGWCTYLSRALFYRSVWPRQSNTFTILWSNVNFVWKFFWWTQISRLNIQSDRKPKSRNLTFKYSKYSHSHIQFFTFTLNSQYSYFSRARNFTCRKSSPSKLSFLSEISWPSLTEKRKLLNAKMCVQRKKSRSSA